MHPCAPPRGSPGTDITDGGGQYVFSVDGASEGALVAEIALDPVFCE